MINNETAVRIMVYEIRDRNPDAVGFVPTPSDIRSILFQLMTKKYDTMMYLYGHRFLMEVLRMFEDAENYEECAEITKQIINHNKVTGDNLPTYK